ncbi:rCG38453 [Rattus norvegicus]|uniref:RCG38453 n=1 Tax=Rattus norvegicus TaxID=10116 RepID=A6KMA3_RAT|nr:rCG38453 [Rattus norvegicus]
MLGGNRLRPARVRGERGRLRARLTRRQVRQHGGHASGCHEHRGTGSRRMQKGSRIGFYL